MNDEKVPDETVLKAHRAYVATGCSVNDPIADLRAALLIAYQEGRRGEREAKVEAQNDAWLKGFISGLTEYAWWKDGTEYVGTCGTTLKTAIERAKKEYGPALEQEPHDAG